MNLELWLCLDVGWHIRCIVNPVIILSDPQPVHMADEWYEIATAKHFWIRRRCEVMRKVGSVISFQDQRIGEIGCGNGLVQQQIGELYGTRVDGFDLNEHALRRSVADTHPRYCYNVFDRKPQFAGHYDILILFDVLEHIENEKPFLEAVLFHLKAGGHLVVNVPALMALYSPYDTVAGHQRRYTLRTLESACASVPLKRVAASYWGLPFLPLLLLRRLLLKGQTDPQRVIQRGYKPPGRLANVLLAAWARLEPIPQRLSGTSLMAIYRKQATG